MIDNHQMDITDNEQDANRLVNHYIKTGFNASWHKSADGAYIVESWED